MRNSHRPYNFLLSLAFFILEALAEYLVYYFVVIRHDFPSSLSIYFTLSSLLSLHLTIELPYSP